MLILSPPTIIFLRGLRTVCSGVVVANDDDDWSEPEMWVDDTPIYFGTTEEAHQILLDIASGDLTITYL